MSIESFPEIENFQKLPREIIVKGASSSFSSKEGLEVRGIVINNIGQPIKNIRVQVVVFNENKLPILGAATETEPSKLPQGGISKFCFKLREIKEETENYYLHTNWSFDESE